MIQKNIFVQEWGKKLDVVLFSKSTHRPNPQLLNDQLHEIHQHLCIKIILVINVFNVQS